MKLEETLKQHLMTDVTNPANWHSKVKTQENGQRKCRQWLLQSAIRYTISTDKEGKHKLVIWMLEAVLVEVENPMLVQAVIQWQTRT